METDGITAELTTTEVVPAKLVQPLTVTVTLYVPAMVADAPDLDGFCKALEKAAGPVHAYVAPVTARVVKLIADPVQTGELLPAVGVAGIGLTTILTVPAALVQPATVTVKEYVPAIAAVTLVNAGGFLTAAE
jgi:hypothetical protein